QINPKRAINILRAGVYDLTRRQQIPLALPVDQIGFTQSRGEQGALALTTYEGDGLPAVKCPDRDALTTVAEDAVVIGNCRQRAKAALGLTVQFVGVGDFCQRPNDHLRGQAILLADAGVAQLLERIGAKLAVGESELTDGVTGSIGRLHGAIERI